MTGLPIRRLLVEAVLFAAGDGGEQGLCTIEEVDRPRSGGVLGSAVARQSSKR